MPSLAVGSLLPMAPPVAAPTAFLIVSAMLFAGEGDLLVLVWRYGSKVWLVAWWLFTMSKSINK